jgi:hypothetical protein
MVHGPKFEVHWSDGAKQLLRKRDHYTREMIEFEFQEKGSRDAVPVDENSRWFATPVVNSRYSVIWKMDDPQHATVEAVVPAQFAPRQAGRLLPQVQRIIDIESGGDVRLIV